MGCWTHVSFTYDMQHDCQVYLKDSWCVLLEGIKLEGEIYCLLHAKKVPNIPSYLLAGDVSNKAITDLEPMRLSMIKTLNFAIIAPIGS